MQTFESMKLNDIFAIINGMENENRKQEINQTSPKVFLNLSKKKFLLYIINMPSLLVGNDLVFVVYMSSQL